MDFASQSGELAKRGMDPSRDGSCRRVARKMIEQRDVGSAYLPNSPQRKFPDNESSVSVHHGSSCILEFGAAASNYPGPAGAGVVLRDVDRSLVYYLPEGLGGLWTAPKLLLNIKL